MSGIFAPPTRYFAHFDYRLLYEDGRPVTYTDRLLKERKNTGEFIFAGTINGVVDLQHKIKLFPGRNVPPIDPAAGQIDAGGIQYRHDPFQKIRRDADLKEHPRG